MNVMSLCDGMSCARIALEHSKIVVNKYYASELDDDPKGGRYAAIVSKQNYPDSIRLGDMTMWCDWEVDWSSIDLLIAGTPCQGLSLAGKGEAFNDPRSKLFFTMNNIRKHINVEREKVGKCDVKFLVENVKTGQKNLDVISTHLGVTPVFINSDLLTAHYRQRYYWSNWDFQPPDDAGVLLQDIVENGVVDRTKSYCINATYHKGGGLKDYFNKYRRQLVFNRVDGTSCESPLISVLSYTHDPLYGYVVVGCEYDGVRPGPNAMYRLYYHRNLTVTECELLQGVPIGFTAHVSNTQRYAMLGNGFTITVITYLLNKLFDSLNSTV